MTTEPRFPHTASKPIEVDNLEVFRETIEMPIRLQEKASRHPRAIDPHREGRFDLTMGFSHSDHDATNINFGLRVGIAVGYLAGAEWSDELMPEDEFLDRVIDIINLWRHSDKECHQLIDYDHTCNAPVEDVIGDKRLCKPCADWNRANPDAGDIKTEVL